MNNVVATARPSTSATVSERDVMTALKNSFYPGASDESVAMVLGYCKAAGLDPMKKPVHIVPIWSKAAGGMIDTVMPGIALYRIEAARTGDYVGKSEPEFGPDQTLTLGGVSVTFPQWCRMTVERMVHGRVCKFTAKEFWLENYATAKRDSDAPNVMWKKRAYGQLAKCAEAQALRMAFPEQTGGTNTEDEMNGKSFAETATIEHTPAPEQPRRTERPTDYVRLIGAKAERCTTEVHIGGLRRQWIETIAKASDAGRPIAEDVQEKVFQTIQDREAEIANEIEQERAQQAAVDVEEIPA
ncbi:phage recombination protein Bet [Tanticharoenia sakaeratensis]|uniref:Phage recombination protein Bet n=1 Tax=Tanticharoenia sakaeratensis NBRC 103193 TaxID=1231623 RepID=A0A0D6MP47_9PROT|nr:phage recombination protein Bet [Tanticharoenia sakaeratensis]GAN55216.1 hypothetical protein Tasa_041_011 [Tanticharoenia sakaeratensis NBRC 103193]GBQ23266.1 hypothetical protein AA103193_2354 [Tanticharoenia sakaeratensis NBRC 103193]